MFSVELEERMSAVIKVIGLGGGGGNAVDSMARIGINDVELIAANTDNQALQNIQATRKIKLGKNTVLGAGGDPEKGKAAAEECSEQLINEIRGTNLLFIAAGMGGGTGTGAAPVVASIAKSIRDDNRNTMVVAVVTKPFNTEGRKKAMIAEAGIAELRKSADVVIVVPNDKVIELIGDDEDDVPLQESFKRVDNVLGQAVRGISELISTSGIINRDMADLERVLSMKGDAHFGVGYYEIGSEDNKTKKIERATKAAELAINNRLLETSIDGARAILINIVGPKDLGTNETNRAMKMVQDRLSENAEIYYGTAIDDNTTGVTVTIFATGLGESSSAYSNNDTLYSPRRNVINEPIPNNRQFNTDYQRQENNTVNQEPVINRNPDYPHFLNVKRRK